MPNPVVRVAAGVVVDARGRILIAKRPSNKHQGGLWEFPGGKIESGESPHSALARELEEEVGIHIRASEPLIEVHHDYPDKSVHLAVLRVDAFDGDAWSREGQEIAWVAPHDLPGYAFPAANTPIIAAARLPRRIMITGEFGSQSELLTRLEQGLARPIGMVQFRAPWLNEKDYVALALAVRGQCRKADVAMMANCSVAAFEQVGCEGLHLSSRALAALDVRPIARRKWLSAACHNQDELAQAQRIAADFAYLSPVKDTQSHPDAEPLGWASFASLAEKAILPVYALGGMVPEDISAAVQHGAQGIAAIGAFWDG